MFSFAASTPALQASCAEAEAHQLKNKNEEHIFPFLWFLGGPEKIQNNCVLGF